ncbi:MAG: Lrp/AsnC family transcriptional regulator [Candidatus Bathyarchaeia archaeon]
MKMENIRLDDKDLRILRVLTADARLSYREIARKLRLSVATVKARIERLEKEGVIEGYTAILNASKLGYDVTAIIEIVVSKGKLIDVEKELAKNPNVYAVYDVTGTSDAFAFVRFKNREDLSRFVKSILGMEYVDRTVTHVVLTTVKEDPRVYV